jgi:hypothetical protein
MNFHQLREAGGCIMSSQLQNDLHQILTDVELPEQVSTQDAAALLSAHMEETERGAAGGAGELVNITQGLEGEITVASSVKIPNLRFKLGDVVLETLKASSAVGVSSVSGTLKTLVIVIRLLQKLYQFATVELGVPEAELLVALYKLNQEEGDVTIDKLVEFLEKKNSKKQISQSLDALEKLGCITYTMDGIRLNETIVVRRKQ